MTPLATNSGRQEPATNRVKGLDVIVIEDSSWLRVQDREIFSKRELKHRATKERSFQEHARKRFPDLHEVDMMNPITFFVEVDLVRILFILYNRRSN